MTSLIHLEAIEKVRFNQLDKDIMQHALEWNKKKKCKCMTEENPKYENLIICEHLQKDCEEKFGKKTDECFKRTLALSKIKLLSDLSYSDKLF